MSVLIGGKIRCIIKGLIMDLKITLLPSASVLLGWRDIRKGTITDAAEDHAVRRILAVSDNNDVLVAISNLDQSD